MHCSSVGKDQKSMWANGSVGLEDASSFTHPGCCLRKGCSMFFCACWLMNWPCTQPGKGLGFPKSIQYDQEPFQPYHRASFHNGQEPFRGAELPPKHSTMAKSLSIGQRFPETFQNAPSNLSVEHLSPKIRLITELWYLPGEKERDMEPSGQITRRGTRVESHQMTLLEAAVALFQQSAMSPTEECMPCSPGQVTD